MPRVQAVRTRSAGALAGVTAASRRLADHPVTLATDEPTAIDPGRPFIGYSGRRVLETTDELTWSGLRRAFAGGPAVRSIVG